MTENIIELGARGGSAARSKTLDRWLRARVHARLASIEVGSLTLADEDGARQFGDPAAALRATLHVRDPRFYRAVVGRGALGGAEAYMNGLWWSDDLTAVVRILALNRETLEGLDSGLARCVRPSLALFRALRPNTRSGSRKNIAAHYDLGNEFFELFLDPTLTYSSGIFEAPDATMEQAAQAKCERICRKLRLGANDHVLEIGTGWGGFALHAAQRYGCRVTTATISRRQYELAHRRVAEAGLSERVDVRFEDYRDLRGRYDKLVSIEMVEAVGHENLEDFFRVCADRLRPEGAMVLQAITIPDQDYEAHKRSVDFIKRYIFPGGELVSLGAMNAAATRATDLRITHLEDITPHYAETLRRWRHRMGENLPGMRALGLDERFLRMWEYYLCYCEGGFEERQIGVIQAVLEKPGARRASVLGRLGP
ncbi:MAG TPA: cyclopropane-fatty-acyl-phospholipid synthase family protein [Myxococcota bacterium]